jgi:beta-lactamase superfamily II metal-dependent hydrolase
VKPWVDGDPFLPRSLYTRRQAVFRAAREKLSALAVVSVSAWMGSMPLMAAHFGIVTPSAVLASMVLVPVVFAILALAIIGLLVGLASEPLEAGLNQVNGALAGGAHAVARGFAALPGSHVELAVDPWWGGGLVVFDLWDGDGAAYFGGGGGVLIDAGGRDEYGRVVFPALRKAGVGADSLVLSHADGGHCGGMARAVEGWGAQQALIPVAKARSPYFRDFVATAGREGCRLVLAEPGRRYPLGDGAELEVLWTPGPEAGGLADDQCQILRLHWRGWKILLTGDAGFETEKCLLEQGVDVRSDVWVTGRHRSDVTGTLEFIRAVGPQVVVAGHARFPATEQVPAWWADMLAREGIELWSQEHTGAVALEADDAGLELKSYLDRSRRVRLTKP